MRADTGSCRKEPITDSIRMRHSFFPGATDKWCTFEFFQISHFGTHKEIWMRDYQTSGLAQSSVITPNSW